MGNVLKNMLLFLVAFSSLCSYGCPAFRVIDSFNEEWSSYEYNYISKRAHLGDEEAAIILFVYDFHVNRKGIHAVEWLFQSINQKGNLDAKLAYADHVIGFPELIVKPEKLDEILEQLVLSGDKCIVPTALYLQASYIELKKEKNYKCYYQKAAFAGSYVAIKRLQRESSAKSDEIKKQNYWNNFAKYSQEFWHDGNYNYGNNKNIFVAGDLKFDKKYQLNKFNLFVSEGLKKFDECQTTNQWGRKSMESDSTNFGSE